MPIRTRQLLVAVVAAAAMFLPSTAAGATDPLNAVDAGAVAGQFFGTGYTPTNVLHTGPLPVTTYRTTSMYVIGLFAVTPVTRVHGGVWCYLSTEAQENVAFGTGTGTIDCGAEFASVDFSPAPVTFTRVGTATVVQFRSVMRVYDETMPINATMTFDMDTTVNEYGVLGTMTADGVRVNL